jgi:hypothetical protein
MDTQSDLSSNALAKGLLYHRTLADRFKIFRTKDGKPATGVSMIENFANRLSMLPWAAHRKSREEIVLMSRGMKEDKPGLRIENLEDIAIKPPEGTRKLKV